MTVHDYFNNIKKFNEELINIKKDINELKTVIDMLMNKVNDIETNDDNTHIYNDVTKYL